MIEYPFPDDPAKTDYCVFPVELENCSLVLFHATPAQNFEAIKSDGFKSAASLGTGNLTSVSFAKRSSGALNRAMTMRANQPGAYCIFAVRYETLERECLMNNISDIHDYSLDPPPELIGRCIVPADYQHL
jgi:hypothetical protein